VKKCYYGTFSNYQEVMGEDRAYPPKKDLPARPTNNCHAEDPPFKPFGTNTTKKTAPINGTFEIFPGEQKGSIRTVKTVKKCDWPEEPPFKYTKNGRSVPITSIATNTRNLKAAYPKYFARK